MLTVYIPLLLQVNVIKIIQYRFDRRLLVTLGDCRVLNADHPYATTYMTKYYTDGAQ